MHSLGSVREQRLRVPAVPAIRDSEVEKGFSCFNESIHAFTFRDLSDSNVYQSQL